MGGKSRVDVGKSPLLQNLNNLHIHRNATLTGVGNGGSPACSTPAAAGAVAPGAGASSTGPPPHHHNFRCHSATSVFVISHHFPHWGLGAAGPPPSKKKPKRDGPGFLPPRTRPAMMFPGRIRTYSRSLRCLLRRPDRWRGAGVRPGL